MKKNPVLIWFGSEFSKLDPLLQDLHKSGGHLRGNVQIEYGVGFSGIIGRRIGRKLGLPHAHKAYVPFTVIISHTENQLIWTRSFDEGRSKMTSVFAPSGQYPDGYWVEQTGNVTVLLGINIKHGAWYWEQRSVLFCGVEIPRLFRPKILAYKKALDGQYEFCVKISAPLFGFLLGYQGVLKASTT